VALLGTVSAMLQDVHGADWLLPAGVVLVGVTMIAAYAQDREQVNTGTTTTIAVMLCFLLGAMSWHGHYQLAAALALATTALLQFKEELHGFAERLSRHDVVAILRFIVLSVLLLPLLPDRGFGPYQALNPYKIWWMVVLISGLSLGGYLLLKLVGPGRGVPLLGVFGGLASSTATTLSFARQVQTDANQTPAARTVILMANLMVLPRLAVLSTVVAAPILPALMPALAGGLLAGGLVVLMALHDRARNTDGAIEVGNPGELRAALSFGLLYALVLVIVAFLMARLGEGGVYAAAAVAGLTDVDAISLSAFDLFGRQQIDAGTAANVVLVAVVANLVFKGAAVSAIAGGPLARPVWIGFGAMAAGLAIGRAVGTALTGA
jgi:uncharacterized membrane protein (DUF4010 family)